MEKIEIPERLYKIINKIKEARKNKGFSHEYIAEKLGISVSAYNKIERQETKLTLERLFQLQAILDIPLEELLDLKVENVYNQHITDQAVGHQQIENLYQENKEITEKLIEAYKEQITYLRQRLLSTEKHG